MAKCRGKKRKSVSVDQKATNDLQAMQTQNDAQTPGERTSPVVEGRVTLVQ